MNIQKIELIFNKVSQHIDKARNNIMRSIDHEMVTTYWLIGRDIVEEEQHGQARAEYGKHLLAELSAQLTKKYGTGFGVENLKRIRQFYLMYKDYTPIGYAVRTESKTLNVNLSWTHYRALMRVSRIDARSFYEIEAVKNNWSGRELERQINSLLFDRLALSKDKDGVLQLAIKGQEITKPEDAIKDPLVLEFLNLPESHKLVESKLEQALIDNLQHFLLELGNGFAFIARQKRLTLEGDHFYADLVFYHTKLKCYVVIDLKTRKLEHGDIGQILMYVNYFDREIKDELDNPTIGLILCSEKNDTMVKYMLNEQNQQIFASKYQLYLPTEAELEQVLQKELRDVRQVQDGTIDQDEKSPYPYKQHLWRSLPFGIHHVKEYKKSDGSIVHEHDAKNPSGKDELKFDEIQIITNKYFKDLTGSPNSNTKLDTDSHFQEGGKPIVDVDQFDQLIRGWTQYWSPLMKYYLEFPDDIDGNWVKALIATESTFNPDPKRNKLGALGLMQLIKDTRDIFANLHGELIHYFVILDSKEWLDPSANICGGIRWLCHKRHLLRHKIGRIPTWEEACWEYKGIYYETTGKPQEIKDNLKIFYNLLQKPK